MKINLTQRQGKMEKSKVTQTILTIMIFMSSFFIHSQTIASVDESLTEDEVFQFLNDAHNSLNSIAQESNLYLDKQNTYFSSAKSSYFIAFATGVGAGSAAVANNAHASGKMLNSVGAVTIAGAATGTVIMAATPLLVVGSFTALPAAALTAVGYSVMTSAFATIIGAAASSKLKRNIPAAGNVAGAAYINSHYRLKLNYGLMDEVNEYGSYGNSTEGSCLLFFAVETWSPGYVINYEIDSCA